MNFDRTICFRGKSLETGEWVEGHVYTQVFSPDSLDEEWHWYIKPIGSDICGEVRVDPFTVGQYTGLTDENGKKVFEGDVVKMHYFFENYAPGTLGVFEDEDVLDVVIKIDKYGVAFEAVNRELTGYLCDYLQDPEAELSVLGNVYDNQEQLGGAA